MYNMYNILFDKFMEKSKRASEGVGGTYFKSSGSLLWDLMSPGSLKLSDVRYAVTDSQVFPIVWYLLGKRPAFDVEIERQLESILPAATDGKTTRVRGRSKPVRRIKRIHKKGVSMSDVVILDVDAMSEKERRAAILWTARTQAFLRSGTIAWRKGEGIYTIDPVTRRLVAVKPVKEIKLAEEWLKWWYDVPVEKRIHSAAETQTAQNSGKSGAE